MCCGRGWSRKGLAYRSPFLGKRKPWMGLSFQRGCHQGGHFVLEEGRYVGNDVVASVCYICVIKRVKRWIRSGNHLIIAVFWGHPRQRNHELPSANPRKTVNETTK